MAWFKFGKQDGVSNAGVAKDAPVETVETMRSRAKRRLIGALVLVVTAVVGFPMLFETQPRPVLVDVPIEIPDKNKLKPLGPPTPSAPSSAPATAAKVDDKSSLDGKEEMVSPAPAGTIKNEKKVADALINSTPDATKSVATDKASSDKTMADKASQAKANAEKAAADKLAAEKAAAAKALADKAAADKSKAEAAKAKALLEGGMVVTAPAASSPTAAQGERFIVQFGSFADVAKSQEVRRKVEKAGLKTYAQVADTAQGKLVRVRVGPFATRAEAEKAASKIKALDLPAAILTL